MERVSLLRPGEFDCERGGSAPAEEGCDEGNPAAYDLALSISRVRGHPDIHDIPGPVVEHLSHEDNRHGFVALALKGDAKGLGCGEPHTKEYQTNCQDDPDRDSHSITWSARCKKE